MPPHESTPDLSGPFHDIAAPTITREAFAPFGELIEPGEDGAPFGAADARLELGAGTPRFYIMRLPRRGLVFHQITRHRRVTQCLASVGGGTWLLAVAPPLDIDAPRAEPAQDQIRGFRIPGDVAVKLHRGTWHAGPFFEAEEMSFFNLELTDTNETDHQSSALIRRFGLPFRFQPDR